MEAIYNSITHGVLTESEVFEQILYDITNDPDGNLQLVVGTDSQTRNSMRVVPVIAIVKPGKGGKWFNRIDSEERSHTIRQKLYLEAQKSLEVAKKLTTFLYENELDSNIIIDVDMGLNPEGKTHSLVKEIVGWITAEGYECRYKPHSIIASSVADRITK
jgi:predicted RNase H-related nuclease YkuK (DUF458 family)